MADAEIKCAIDINKENVRVIAPGLVLIKGGLKKETQQYLCEFALKTGNQKENGFWVTLSTGEKVLNNTPKRGRLYNAIGKYSEYETLVSLCNESVKAAQSKDSKMPEQNPTHLLLLYYTGFEGMCWHRDTDPNDGDNDHPVVSFSIGNSCDFGYKLLLQPQSSIRLDSGDILLFGGPNRLIEHSVLNIHENTSPDFLPDLKGVRLNFTFRDVPKLIGKEMDWKITPEFGHTKLVEELKNGLIPGWDKGKES